MSSLSWVRAAAAVLALVSAAPRSAQACGGFFCSNVPVDQTGERVLFAVDKASVTAHIQILYTGEAEKFAWVLPLPTEPTDIGVGTDLVFRKLEQATDPQFQLNWANTPNCYPPYWGFAEDAAAGGGPPNAGGPKSGGVEILLQKEVGPFDATVLKGTTADSGEAVFEWLNKNGYVQPPQSKDLVNTYVAENHVFVAVKLQKDQKVGDIQPLVLKFPFPGSCVPLRLTSIAATQDMDVWVYMLGQHRAVPMNFFHVEINEAKLSWLTVGYQGRPTNYKEIATDAVDLASGRGFLTEYAGDTIGMPEAIWTEGIYNLELFAQKKTPWDFYAEMMNQGMTQLNSVQLQNVIRAHIPMPKSVKDKGISEQQFYSSLQTYKTELAGQPFDPIAFVKDLETKFFAPLKEASKLFASHRMLTRMYTIISPSEMARDPIFLFNPDLPNVSNLHKAVGKAICAEGKTQPDKVEITLGDGTKLVYKGPFQGWNGIDSKPPVAENDAQLGGAAKTVAVMDTQGDPEIIAAGPNIAAEKAKVQEAEKLLAQITIATLIVNHNASPGVTAPTKSATSGTGSGCQSGRTMGFGGVATLLLVGFGAMALRRRLSR